jgi:DNA-binding LacI/PurR family transcriptional regulator
MRLAEIAQEANVSPATVSRVINSPELVSDERRKQVQDVLKRFNYQPAPKERRRGPKRSVRTSRRIGVWFVGAKKSPSLNWFQDQIGQIRSAHDHNQIDLRVLFSETAAEVPVAVQKGELDGVIIQGMEPSATCLQAIGDLPYVWFMTRRTLAFPGDYVEPNNWENGRMAADYLESRGHATAAIIATDPDYSAMHQRIQAFLQRAGELGMRAVAIHRPIGSGPGYLNPSPLPEELDELFSRFAGLEARPSGVYLPSDHFCGSFFRSMRHRGLEPAKDFEVVLGNFTDVVYQNLDPLPAAIDVNLSTLVSTVLRHLLWRIDNRGAPGRVGISISPTLVLPGRVPLSS